METDLSLWLVLCSLTNFIINCSCQTTTTMIVLVPSPSSTAQVAQAFTSSAFSNNMTLSVVKTSITATQSSAIKQSVTIPTGKPTIKEPTNPEEDEEKEKKEKKEFIAIVSGCCAGGFFALATTITVIISHVKMEKERKKLSENDNVQLNGYYIRDNEGLQMDNYS